MHSHAGGATVLESAEILAGDFPALIFAVILENEEGSVFSGDGVAFTEADNFINHRRAISGGVSLFEEAIDAMPGPHPFNFRILSFLLEGDGNGLFEFLAVDAGAQFHFRVAGTFVTAIDANRSAVVKVGEFLRFEIVDIDAIDFDFKRSGDRASKFAAKRAGLACEIVTARDKGGDTAGFPRHLFKHGTIYVVADADAENSGVGRPCFAELNERGAILLLAEAVTQDDDVKWSIRSGVFECGGHGWCKNSPAARGLTVEIRERFGFVGIIGFAEFAEG